MPDRLFRGNFLKDVEGDGGLEQASRVIFRDTNAPCKVSI